MPPSFEIFERWRLPGLRIQPPPARGAERSAEIHLIAVSETLNHFPFLGAVLR
jgi:hypothetical protein